MTDWPKGITSRLQLISVCCELSLSLMVIAHMFDDRHWPYYWLADE